jgi:hypothetical protein
MRPEIQPETRRVATLTLERPVAPELAPACRTPIRAARRRASRRPAWRLGCGR